MIMLAVTNVQQANALTAGDVLNKMDPKQAIGYMDGIVEGLAFARWIKDKPSKVGMKCIYDWYYSDAEKIHGRITTWFNRHSDKPAGALMYVLTKKECGE